MAAGEIYIRFGAAPEGGRSRNDETGELEVGVSCYRAMLNRDEDVLDLILPNDTSAATAMSLWGQRDAYRVHGEQVGTGGDGEPVLTITSSTPLGTVEVVNYSVEG